MKSYTYQYLLNNYLKNQSIVHLDVAKQAVDYFDGLLKKMEPEAETSDVIQIYESLIWANQDMQQYLT